MSCYNIYWYQNLVPEKNEDGDIINCYDQNWNMNWKWITYIDTEEIDGIENAWRVKIEVDFLNWKENGNMIFYYENWQIQLSVSYINWIEDGKRISYYENWQIRWEWTNKNWKKDWKEIYYYDNWQIKSESIYKNWKLIK
jgi:antitoxin component YwqK of YwqJK toxin-antitoxin module